MRFDLQGMIGEDGTVKPVQGFMLIDWCKVQLQVSGGTWGRPDKEQEGYSYALEFPRCTHDYTHMKRSLAEVFHHCTFKRKFDHSAEVQKQLLKAFTAAVLMPLSGMTKETKAGANTFTFLSFL